MKSYLFIFITIISLLFIYSCSGSGPGNKTQESDEDVVTVPDTGYTGIKQYMSGTRVVREVTFENGVQEGVTKSFYPDGRLRQTFWYENGLREDSAKWYYMEGQVFRSTPYKNDTISGTQKQYYRTGRLKAKLNYIKGLRTPTLEEYTQDGKLVGGYPSIVVNIKDNYQTKGIYTISLELSDKSTRVNFYRGDFDNGVFDTTKCLQLKTIKGIANLDLRKTGSQKRSYVGVIAEILTNYGNKYLAYKKIDLPYNDLN